MRSVIETRSGSSYVLKQQVWGTQYIDELVQIGINQDPENADTALPDNQEENQCERFFYVAQDSNHNVLGVVYNTGVLCERYEYTPYGRRTTYSREEKPKNRGQSPILESGNGKGSLGHY